MKQNIQVAVLLLATGLSMTAKDRDLTLLDKGNKISTNRQVSELLYDKLTPREQRQLVSMALQSGLQAHVLGARDAINRKFKLTPKDWAHLEKVQREEGLDGVMADPLLNSSGATKAGAPISMMSPGIPLAPPMPPVKGQASTTAELEKGPIQTEKSQESEEEKKQEPAVKTSMEQLTPLEKELVVINKNSLYALSERTGEPLTKDVIDELFNKDLNEYGYVKALAKLQGAVEFEKKKLDAKLQQISDID